MRVLLFTGKGGVGKTTAAAGTAALAASAGHRTLVLSTDPAHSLADAFGLAEPVLGQGPSEIDNNLWLLHVDVRDRFAKAWGDIQSYLLDVLDSAGVDPMEAQELTVLPGAEEVLALLEVRDRVRSGLWDVVILDCAPTAETLRLLSLPDALRWYMERIWPTERRVLGLLRPVLTRASGVPMPGNSVLDAIERLHADLSDVREILTAHEASVRLVTTPEAVVFAESRRTLTSLSLYGYRVDGIVVNRLFPAENADEWRNAWIAAQSVQLERIESDCDPLPVWRSLYQSSEPVGIQEVRQVARDMYGDHDPVAVHEVPDPMNMERDGVGYRLSLSLPLVARGDVDLARRGDELVVTVGPHRRILSLPSALHRCKVSRAQVSDGRLLVFFIPDPDVWTSRQ
ncbi:MAG: TRC40/GET3/ArsA family transport-energizing ATPase [Actinomycetes bacterium]